MSDEGTKRDSIVCPESTLESANQRRSFKKAQLVAPASISEDDTRGPGSVACESTLDSVKRRDFIRKAALATAAVGVGSTILASNIISESSATKASPDNCPNPTFDNLTVEYSTFVDVCNPCSCNGNPSWGIGEIYFGGSGKGERIGSQRNCITQVCPECSFVCFPPGKNLNGLDFYTNRIKRVSITNSGNVGIGTCTPNAPLSLGETIGDKIFLFDYPGEKYGLSIASCELRMYHAVQPTNHTSFGNYNGTTFTEFMRLTNQGRLGIGTPTPGTSLQVNGSVSAKTVVATDNYKMGASDFAVLASGAIKVTLPPAGTAAGMIVFIKNTSTNTVTIERSGTDTIESASSKKLKKQYDSLQLISNGTNEWYILGNSICSAFIS